MADPRGFLKWDREEASKRAPDERVLDSAEVGGLLSDEERTRQTGRCMDCGVPFCMQGCPLGNRIPDWNDLLFRGKWRAAWTALESTNNFPEFTGRLCPAPCEAACVLNVNQSPVTIEQIEKEIVEHAFDAGWIEAVVPTQRTDKSVAVVGSGPAGLAAAAQLNAAGHTVTVFERSDKIGGLLRYGIPDFKMEKSIIDRRIDLLEAEGIRFELNADVGVSIAWDDLRANHDAVVLAVGASRPRELNVPGRESGGVYLAMNFLEAQNRAVERGERSTISATEKSVVILGGGDTGSDCLGTALRQNATSVTQIELLPMPPAVRSESNPWPEWPVVFRTSSSQEEGGVRAFAQMTKRVLSDEGTITAIEVVDVEFVDGELSEIEGSERSIPCDVLILAMGYVGAKLSGLDAELDRRGNVKTDETFRTSIDGVFAIGDAKRGASLIVWAISDGREAARAVDLFLQGESTLPTRGIDQPF